MLSNAPATLPRRTWRSHKRQAGAAVGGAVLAACAVAGVLTWQIGSHTTSHRAAPSAAVLPAAAGGNLSQAATRGGVADSILNPPAAGVSASARTSPAPWIILVGSADQVASVQPSIDAADRVAAENGAPFSTVDIMVIDPSQAILLRQLLTDENRFRASLELPDITVTDLTQPAATPTPAGS